MRLEVLQLLYDARLPSIAALDREAAAGERVRLPDGLSELEVPLQGIMWDCGGGSGRSGGDDEAPHVSAAAASQRAASQL